MNHYFTSSGSKGIVVTGSLAEKWFKLKISSIRISLQRLRAKEWPYFWYQKTSSWADGFIMEEAGTIQDLPSYSCACQKLSLNYTITKHHVIISHQLCISDKLSERDILDLICINTIFPRIAIPFLLPHLPCKSIDRTSHHNIHITKNLFFFLSFSCSFLLLFPV